MRLLLVAMLCTASRASQVELTIQTEDYRVTQETRSALQRMLQRMMGVFAGRLQLPYPQAMEVELLIVGDRARYEALAAGVQMPHWSSGFYDRSGRAVVWGNTSEGAMLRTFLHESSHFLLAHGGRPAPQWLNEGLAECFSAARLSGNAVYLDPRADHLSLLRADLGAGRLRTPEAIGKGGGSWLGLDASEARARYAYAWGLTSMLLATEPGRAALRTALDDFARTGDETRLANHIDAHWPGGLHDFAEDWPTWVTEGPPPLSLSISSGAPAGAAAGGWLKCGDGRLVRADDPQGCGGFVRQPDGTLVR